MPAQPCILAPVPAHCRYITFRLDFDGDPEDALGVVAEAYDPKTMVVGIGEPLVDALGKEIDGLHTLDAHSGPGFSVPSTPMALWCWLRGDDRGELLHATRKLEAALAEEMTTESIVEGFRHLEGRDLTGYIDGTENPTGDDAARIALVEGAGKHFDGGSFVAVQQWLHDLDEFESQSRKERDLIIGRRYADNEEIANAPPSAHVKRTAQEDFSPPAFLVRRSMPWTEDDSEGLMFVAFGSSLDPFERQLRRMVGADDGVVDGLFSFTQPITSSAFWCPPVWKREQLDLEALQ